MEWLRSIDLSEYAPNLRGSGVHGAIMVFEPRFSSTVLSDILSIPVAKTLLRRHLNTHFIDLIGVENQLLKRDAELKQSYTPLSAATKIKLVRQTTFVSVYTQLDRSVQYCLRYSIGQTGHFLTQAYTIVWVTGTCSRLQFDQTE